jgi:cell division septum initiation protein DivIVA
MAKMNLFLLLDHLGNLAESKFQLAGKVWLDKDELEELVDKIRIALPEEIKEAERINRERERYLGQAQEEAERILREAEAYVDRLIHENQITLKAEDEADRIIEDARRAADSIEEDAFNYASQVLQQLEQSLERTLKVVQNGRSELTKQSRKSNESSGLRS